jgi:hypothetical protein
MASAVGRPAHRPQVVAGAGRWGDQVASPELTTTPSS